MIWSVILIIVRFLIWLYSGLLVSGWLLRLLGMRLLFGLGLLLLCWRLGLCPRLQVSFLPSLGLLLLLMLWLLRLGRLLLGLSFLLGRSL